MIDKDYLEFCGFKKVDNDVVYQKGNYNRVPTLSCKLNSVEGSVGDNVVFVLSFYPDVNSYKFQKEFTFDQLNVIINSIGDGKGDLFYFFSLSDSFLSKVRNARFSGGGRKPWKKRNWPLPFKWAKIKSEFGIDNVFIAPIDSEERIQCLENMRICIKKAAQSYSYQPFELYYSSFNELLRLDGKKGRGSRKIAWSQFKNAVEALQKEDLNE